LQHRDVTYYQDLLAHELSTQLGFLRELLW